MKKLYENHPGLLKFMLFSVILLLLLIMVSIQTGDTVKKNNSSLQSNEAVGQENNGNTSESDDNPNGEEVSAGEDGKRNLDDEKNDLEKSDDSDKKKNGEDAQDIRKTAEKIDVFEIIGEEVTEVEKKLGKGIAKGTPNTCYFMSSGAIASYDIQTERIISVELDDSGDGRFEASVAGVMIGDDLSDAREKLINEGIDIIDLEENSFICSFYLGSEKETVYEIYVLADEEEKVSSVTLSVK